MTLQLRHIRYFLAVAEERHFTRAAAKVGIGQPPLSQQIKDLEAEIGAPLFHRLAHGAELTAAGQAFLDGVKDMPTLAQRAVKAATRASRGETGSLRLGFTHSSAFNAVVPTAIRTFRRAYPDVELTLEDSNTTLLEASLRSGSLDVVFLRPGAARDKAMQFRPVAEEPMVAVPAGHAAARQKRIHLENLQTDPFLLFPREIGPALYDSIIAACRTAGFEPIVGQVAPQIASIINLVAAELGVSIVPASMSQLQIAGVTYHSIADHAPTARLALACRRGETSPIVRNFIANVASGAELEKLAVLEGRIRNQFNGIA